MEKKYIRNRKGQGVVVLVEKSEDQKGLAFIMHGLGGFKEQPHIKAMAEAFQELQYTVVRFDTANTAGESEGRYEDATVTGYLHDLEDVIAWAAKKSWYEEPFCLAGHSLGSFCVGLFAQRHQEKVKALIPCATVVSGRLTNELYSLKELKEWEQTGWQIRKSTTRPGVVKRLPWSHIVDRLQYDLLEGADMLTMPVLLIVGEEDTRTPPTHQALLYNALPGRKLMHIVKGARHGFYEPEQREELKNTCSQWIKTLGVDGGNQSTYHDR
jgi:alpha-beta hydrolase superfamily lysophospholipase